MRRKKNYDDDYRYGEAFLKIERDLRKKKKQEKEKVCLLLLSPRGIKR